MFPSRLHASRDPLDMARVNGLAFHSSGTSPNPEICAFGIYLGHLAGIHPSHPRPSEAACPPVSVFEDLRGWFLLLSWLFFETLS